MTIFSRIIAQEIPSYRIAENDLFYAFLDISPLVKGHTLVVPKTEIDKFFDMPHDYLQQLLLFAQPIARAIEQAFDCKRCGLSVIGLEVPHAHLHLVPLNSADDLNFTRPKLSPTPAEMKDAQDRICKHLR
ncbi:MAG: HIT family protein [Williamsia sp.]|nr:HIT family protein [Williamsia sp.]